jgi:hypothetical protein
MGKRYGMHRTTINIPTDLYQRARIKALREDLSISEVIRDLLNSWTAGEITITPPISREKMISLARAGEGMWSDRDPDLFLADSRAGFDVRDREISNARLDA